MAALAPDFAKMVPGFDFLQGLVKNASSVMPNIGQWVAPTLDPEVIDKRIDELRTVQFWLEQNARMLAATIQALEVQRMTLSTLRTMNVQVSDLQEAMRIKVPEIAPAAAARSEAPPEAADSPLRSEDEDAPAATGLVDPMQWWGALTQQFTQLATEAMKEVATDPARAFAGSIQAMNPAHAPSPKPAPARKPAAAGPAPSGTAPATATARKPAAGKKAPTRKTAARKTARRAAT